MLLLKKMKSFITNIEEKKKILGDLYINAGTKDQYILAINRFLNLTPNYTPKADTNSLDNEAKMFFMNSNYTILNKNLHMIRKPSYELSDGRKNFWIVIDKNDGKKKIFVRRGYQINSKINEMSTKLSLMMLQQLYCLLVTDICDIKILINNFTKLRKDLKKFENKFLVNTKLNDQYQITKYTKIEFSEKNCSIFVEGNRKIIHLFNDSSLNRITYTPLSCNMQGCFDIFNKLEKFYKIFDNEDDMKKFIAEDFNDKFEKIKSNVIAQLKS